MLAYGITARVPHRSEEPPRLARAPARSVAVVRIRRTVYADDLEPLYTVHLLNTAQARVSWVT
jgi:hypothetical protein